MILRFVKGADVIEEVLQRYIRTSKAYTLVSGR